MSNQYLYYRFYKPFGVLSQFTKEIPEHITLADFLDVPEDVYPVGRLDKDSEGLLLLTNDNKFKTTLLDPQSNKKKTYHAQLDGIITKEAIQNLNYGVTIKTNKKQYNTLPAIVKEIDNPSHPERFPPIRYRAEIPTSWISITISEGKNRQVRKMCAKVGFPVLRLIRISIEGYSLRGLAPGSYLEFTP